MMKSLYISFSLIFIPFLSLAAQDFSINLLIKNPKPLVDIKLYSIVEPFDINTLNTNNYLNSGIQTGSNLYKIEGVLDERTSLYKLHINKNDDLKTHLNTSSSTIFLHLKKNDYIFIEINSNDFFQKYQIKGSRENIELKKLHDIEKKIKNANLISSTIEHDSLIANTKYPEVFFIGIRDSIDKYERNLNFLNSITIIENRINNDFHENIFSKQLRPNMKNLRNNYTIIVILLFMGVFIFLCFKYYLFIQKNRLKRILYSLSLRERNILFKLKSDKTNTELANELFIEPSTLKKHLSNIYKKIQVTNKKEAIFFASKIQQLKIFIHSKET
ncbi:helix-turn-helix transcriptional regulator [uncultured Tenacibaculum sp.]|uniref:helix-turn-helix domain-containing protein n=1 Tax=uncultured Tenacibaculum sp. TaxID=174713 RepID=UPI002605CBD1|nr:helix-turn-helix transcriptional regulator [uncultured Tenacibaculum sp.]